MYKIKIASPIRHKSRGRRRKNHDTGNRHCAAFLPGYDVPESEIIPDNISTLDVSFSSHLRTLSPCIGRLKNLKRIVAVGCPNLVIRPETIASLEQPVEIQRNMPIPDPKPREASFARKSALCWLNMLPVIRGH